MGVDHDIFEERNKLATRVGTLERSVRKWKKRALEAEAKLKVAQNRNLVKEMLSEWEKLEKWHESLGTHRRNIHEIGRLLFPIQELPPPNTPYYINKGWLEGVFEDTEKEIAESPKGWETGLGTPTSKENEHG